MKMSQIPSFVEPLEPRVLLSGELAEYQLVVADLGGAPIAAVNAGQDFQLIVKTNDLRATPQGVWAGYVDVVYDNSLVHPTGGFTYGAVYANMHSGSTLTSGLLDEVGGFAGSTAPGSGAKLLFSINFHADANGSAVFTSNPADNSPGHDTLIFGNNDPLAAGQIIYGQATVAVQTPAQDSNPPTADLAAPTNGASIADTVINAGGHIDVTFTDTGGSGLDAATITDAGAEFTLTGPGVGTAVVNGAAVLVSGTTYRYSFGGAFVAGAVAVGFTAGTFADIQGNPNVAATQGFTVTSSAPQDTTPPTANLAVPANGGSISDAAINAGGHIDVTFTDTGGSGLDAATITDAGAEFTLSGAGVGTAAVNGAAVLVSGTTYRYSFTGAFVAGAVSVGFTAGTFADVQGNPNVAATQGFTVTASTQPDTTPPTANLASPANGATISTVAINPRGYIDVTFADAGGSGLDAATVTDAGAEFTLSGAGVGTAVVNGAAVLVTGTTFRYSFAGAFVDGAVSVAFTAGTFADVQGNPNLAETESFTVQDAEPPTADLAVPANGATIADTVINAGGHIDVTFADTGGSGLDASTITDAAAEFTLSGAGVGTVVVNGAAVLVTGTTYRYSFAGAFVAGPVTVNFAPGTWDDNRDNANLAATEGFTVQDAEPPTADLASPANGWSIASEVINPRGYFDVTFADTGGSGLAASTITDAGAEFTLSGVGVGTAVVNGAAVLVTGSTYRYSFTGAFVAGAVSVAFTAGTWADNQGNVNLPVTEGFTVSEGVPQIAVSGSGQPIASGDTTPATADGTDFGTVDVAGAVAHTFTISNSGAGPLSMTGVQITGANAADFTVTALPASPVAGGGGSTTFELRFSPGGTGVRTATVTIPNSADVGTYSFDVQGFGGRSVAFDTKNKATYRDASGDAVTVALTGTGSGLVWLPTVDPQGHSDATSIVLANTGPKSALTITTAGAGSATTVGGIQVSGSSSLGTITGKTTSLNGAIVVPGLLGAVAMNDLAPGSSIDVNAALAAIGTTQLTLTFNLVTDTSANTHSEPVKSITATEWANTPGSDAEQIIAPWIGTITTVGRKANPRAVPPMDAVAGDFAAGLVLSGVGVPTKTPTLGTVKVAGGVGGTSWDVSGDAGAITVAGSAEGWTLQGAGTAGAGLRTIKTLTLADVDDTTILADGALGAVKALNWDGGAITADSLTSLSITGRKATAAGLTALPGDFRNADLTLRAGAAPAAGKASITALGSATIAGSLASSTWAVDMDAGAITVAGAVTGWTLAGASDGDAVDLLSVKSLTLGNVADANVTVKTARLNVTSATHQVTQVTAGGVLGAVKALNWAAGTIEADSLASLTITGRKATAAAPTEILGDFGAAVTLHGQNLAAHKPAAGAVAIAHNLTASLWQVTGSMAGLTVTHAAQDSTVRVSGSIQSITLGAGYGNRFLAGVTDPLKLDPAAVTSADLESTGLASIGSVTIKGWTTPGQPTSPDFLRTTGFLAPSVGTVSVLNSDLSTWKVYALGGSAGLRIKSISHKDNRDLKNAAKNWTWTPAKNVPVAAAGAARQIP